MVLTTWLYALASNSALVYGLPGTIARLFRLAASSLTSSIAVRQTDAVALEVIKWIMVHIVLPRRPKSLLAGSSQSPYPSSEKDNGGPSLFFQDTDKAKYYPGLNNTWFFRGWRPFFV